MQCGTRPTIPCRLWSTASRLAAKKVLVLHTNKNFDQQRTNWVMHQYHLGDLEQEKERELVLCKIFYQTNTRARSKKIIS